MFNRQYLVASLTLLVAPIVFCSTALAGETQSSSAAKPFAPRVANRQQSLQQVVNEVSRPTTSRRRAVVSSHRHAHWKTRYWNQKSTSKHK
jgi:hypothetical protein